jgi:hypothetical protein
VCKNRTSDTRTFAELGDMLESVSRREQEIFSELFEESRTK